MEMTMKPTEIWSIYGQIEAVVAREMVKEKKFNQIPYMTIPPNQHYNEQGQKIQLAVVVPQKYIHEFIERVANLRE
jgi:hypothetical protein